MVHHAQITISQCAGNISTRCTAWRGVFCQNYLGRRLMREKSAIFLGLPRHPSSDSGGSDPLCWLVEVSAPAVTDCHIIQPDFHPPVWLLSLAYLDSAPAWHQRVPRKKGRHLTGVTTLRDRGLPRPLASRFGTSILPIATDFPLSPSTLLKASG